MQLLVQCNSYEVQLLFQLLVQCADPWRVQAEERRGVRRCGGLRRRDSCKALHVLEPVSIEELYNYIFLPCVMLKYEQEGRCKATDQRELKLPGREAGPPHHQDDKVDSDK